MFNQTQFRTLYAFHWHTTRHLMDLAAQLDEADYTDNPGYGHGSIHGLLFHLLNTDQGWRGGLETGQQPPVLRKEDYPDLKALRAQLEVEERAWEALLERLNGVEIEGECTMTSARGETVPLARWHILQHLVLHGMQHHTEIAQLLTAKGRSPDDLDFIFYV